MANKGAVYQNPQPYTPDRDTYKPLVTSVFLRAAEEAQAGSVEAAIWLLSDGPVYADVLDLDYKAILRKVIEWWRK
jgi:hypothetical protein